MKKIDKLTAKELAAVESPPLSDEILANMRPVFDKHPSIPNRVRGQQKRPVKESTTIRLSPDVLSAFKATGRGWQGRIDGALREWLKEHEAH